MTQEVKTNDMCAICWKDLPPLLDETNLVQRATAPILHKADSGFIHRLCSIECAGTLFSARRLLCPVNGCDEPLVENLAGMDKRISELFGQTLFPEDVLNESLPPEERLRLWLLNVLDGLPDDHGEDQRSIREHPEEWHRDERLFLLAWGLVLRESRERLWLNVMYSCAERDPASFRRSMLATLFDCAISLRNCKELERVIRLSFSHPSIERLTLRQLGSLLRAAADASYELLRVLFCCIHLDDRPKVLALAIDDLGRRERHFSIEARCQSLLKLFQLAEEWPDLGVELAEEIFNSPLWATPEHVPILLDFCERRGIALNTITQLNLLKTAIIHSSQDLVEQILRMNPDSEEDFLSLALLCEAQIRHFSSELEARSLPFFSQILLLMQKRGSLAHRMRLIFRSISDPIRMNLFLSACKEQRIRLAPADLSAALQNMLGVDRDVCETILSMAESKEDLFDNLIIEFATDRQFRALLDLLQGSAFERFLEKNIRFFSHSHLRSFFNCIDERGIQLSVECRSSFLFNALRSNDDALAKQILSNNVSLQFDVICQLAKDLCLRWGWDENGRQEILGTLTSLLELASNCGNYENLKEKVTQFSDLDLLEEISNAPEWWISQGRASSQGCAIS